MSQQWQHVRNNQVNSSSSKSTYAFPKQQRFRSYKLLCDTFYNIPSHIGHNRSAGIGKGTKLTFGKKKNVPAPGNYNIKSNFDQKSKGVKFSLGRQKIKYGAIPLQTQTPEPGKYSHSQEKLIPSKAYTMRKKLEPLVPSYKFSPGPGQYNFEAAISPAGKYTLSKIGNCSVPKIKQMKDYDQMLYRRTPGPGAYNHQKQNMNNSGLYYNSKYGDSRCRSFSRSSRKDIVPASKKRLPGPGAYNYFSQFGCR